MTTSDAAFLAEVDSFLTSCDLPILPSVPSLSESDDSSEKTLSSSNSEEPPKRLVSLASKSRSASRKIKNKVDAATKRKLEKEKDRKRRKAYRERRLMERESLQQEFEKLTEELKRAQHENNTIASLWEMLAERQLTARMNAEAEQQQLSCKTSQQRKMNSMLYRQKRVRQEPTDDAIFAAYIQELDGVYDRTAEVLRSGGLDPTEANWDDPSESWTKDLDTGYFEYRGKLTLPFSYDDICRSRWYTAPLLHRQESRQIFEDVDDPDNTVALKFRITTRLASGKIASVLQRLVIRRHEEAGRMVMVWRLFTEGEGIFIGMHADETGWGVAAPVKKSSQTGTVMTTCVQNVPMHLDSVAAREPAVKQFAGKLFDWGTENHNEVMKRVASLQLGDV
ncbi:unnamed protein product [Phytophthora lilii]|uniref:Unnamed protein product n=1 Tax=Phytophthora lilii TaxID=2077276 RepID=A0A9W7CI06_9STRA|nr:unnamed protein product [Phytophthora lilii]